MQAAVQAATAAAPPQLASAMATSPLQTVAMAGSVPPTAPLHSAAANSAQLQEVYTQLAAQSARLESAEDSMQAMVRRQEVQAITDGEQDPAVMYQYRVQSVLRGGLLRGDDGKLAGANRAAAIQRQLKKLMENFEMACVATRTAPTAPRNQGLCDWLFTYDGSRVDDVEVVADAQTAVRQAEKEQGRRLDSQIRQAKYQRTMAQMQSPHQQQPQQPTVQVLPVLMPQAPPVQSGAGGQQGSRRGEFDSVPWPQRPNSQLSRVIYADGINRPMDAKCKACGNGGHVWGEHFHPLGHQLLEQKGWRITPGWSPPPGAAHLVFGAPPPPIPQQPPAAQPAPPSATPASTAQQSASSQSSS